MCNVSCSWWIEVAICESVSQRSKPKCAICDSSFSGIHCQKKTPSNPVSPASSPSRLLFVGTPPFERLDFNEV